MCKNKCLLIICNSLNKIRIIINIFFLSVLAVPTAGYAIKLELATTLSKKGYLTNNLFLIDSIFINYP